MIESILDCKVCHSASFDKHRSRSKENTFRLCESCSNSLARTEITVLQSVEEGPYCFEIFQQGEELKVNVSQAARNGFHSTLNGTYLNIKDCLVGIKSWLNRPFKMAGSLANIF